MDSHRGARNPQHGAYLTVAETLDRSQVEHRTLLRRQPGEKTVDVDPKIDRLVRGPRKSGASRVRSEVVHRCDDRRDSVARLRPKRPAMGIGTGTDQAFVPAPDPFASLPPRSPVGSTPPVKKETT